MNDRLKFRVWQKFTIDGDVTTHLSGEEDWFALVQTGEIYTYGFSGMKKENLKKYDEFVVEQCTGLKDKNGKLVFEGDIIKAFRQIEPPMIDLRKLKNIPDDERFIFRIDYKKDSCCYVFTILKKFSDGDIDCYHRNIIPYYEVDELNKDSIEVIGNIHQNSELLEKGGK